MSSCLVDRMNRQVKSVLPDEASKTGTSVHLVESYLPVTQNWLFRRLQGLQRFRPVVVAGDVRDADKYPLGHIETLDYYKRIRYRVLDKITGGMFVFHNANFHTLNAIKPSIVHSHFAPEAVKRQEFRALARKRFRCPTVSSFYGHDLRGLTPGKRWPGFDQLLKEETAYIIQGPKMAEHMVSLGCDPDKIYINPLGIDLNLFPERANSVREGVLRVLTVGRFVEKKGISDAVRAAAIAHRAGVQIHLTVAGDGPFRREIENTIMTESAGDIVSLLGTIEYAQLCPLYYEHDVCLQPSVTASDGDTEGGANMCIIEAMAAGMPIVATHHADTGSTVAEGEHAFLAPEHCPDQLAEALVALGRDRDLWRSYSKAGRARACRLFDAKRQAGELEEIYGRILKRF